MSFSTVLAGIKAFVDAHPGEVIILDIQDARPRRHGQAFIDAGLEPTSRRSTDEQLPTLGELVDAGTNLIVFAERGGTGAPPWYQSAYDGGSRRRSTTSRRARAFDCLPNRGGTTGKLFLVNHWVTTRGRARARPTPPTVPRCCCRASTSASSSAASCRTWSPSTTPRARPWWSCSEARRGRPTRPAQGDEPEDTTAPTTTVSATPSGPITTLTGGDPDLVCAEIPES